MMTISSLAGRRAANVGYWLPAIGLYRDICLLRVHVGICRPGEL
jgi:hypothetical protein